MTRSQRSKVLETATAFVPGPGTYEVGEPIRDYRGIYKNMGKKKKIKEKKKEHAEGEESEEEEEQEKDSEGSDNDEQEKKDVVPDAVGELAPPEVEAEMLRSLIPGYS